jgi:hypothetical protein
VSVPCPSSLPSRPIELSHLRALLEATLAAPPDPTATVDPVDLPDEPPRPDGPIAIGVHGHGEGVEVAVRPLAGPDPVRSLYGFVAPPEWFAFGVVARGTARRPGPAPDRRPTGRAPQGHVQFGLLVTRLGEQVVAARGDDGVVEQIHRIDPADQGGGRIPDACRRALRLATPPPEGDTGELWATLWLETLLVRSLGDPRPIPWPEAVRAYPAFEAVVEGDPALCSLVGDHLVELGQAARRAWPWEQLLASSAAGLVPACGVEPGAARWMDVGMFSREVLGQFPPLSELVADLSSVLDADVVDRIERCLDGWGLR